MLEEQAFRAALRRYASEELCGNQLVVEDDTELLISGLLDSLAVAQLLEFIESETGMAIPATDLIAENFCSIDAIVVYLAAVK